MDINDLKNAVKSDGGLRANGRIPKDAIADSLRWLVHNLYRETVGAYGIQEGWLDGDEFEMEIECVANAIMDAIKESEKS